MNPEHTQIGTVSSAHGTRGAIKLYTLGDPERLLELERVFLEGRGWLKVQQAEAHGPAVMYKFLGVDTREAAEDLKGMKVYAHDTELPALEEGEHYLHALIGLPVRSPQGEDLGTVIHVLELGYGELLEVRRGLGSYLVPLQAPYVELHPGEAVVLDAPEGLLEG